MDAHDAAEKIVEFDGFATEFAKERGDAGLGGVMAEGIEDVTVGRGVAAKEQAEDWNNEAQVGEIECAPDRVRRFAEVENKQRAAGLQDAKKFGNAFSEIGEIPKAVTDGNDPKVAFRKGQIEGIRLEVGDAGLALTSDTQHARTEIRSDDLRTRGGERFGEVAGAAANIESAVAGLDGGELEQAAFPIAVQAKALKVVDQIVTARDAVK